LPPLALLVASGTESCRARQSRQISSIRR
jgi:hypothetical protein